jgi:hypothetical protein
MLLLDQEGKNGFAERDWYRELFSAMCEDAGTLKTFSEQNCVTLVTYNYDRSLERFFVRALRTKYLGSATEEYISAMDNLGVYHLHGQLGKLPELVFTDLSAPRVSQETRQRAEGIVPYGGSETGITHWDVKTAARFVQIIHEANPLTDAFARTKGAIASAKCVVFLGFGFGAQNVLRLGLRDCMPKDTQIYICATGLTENQQQNLIRMRLQNWDSNLHIGKETHDIIDFFRHRSEILYPPR